MDSSLTSWLFWIWIMVWRPAGLLRSEKTEKRIFTEKIFFLSSQSEDKRGQMEQIYFPQRSLKCSFKKRSHRKLPGCRRFLLTGWTWALHKPFLRVLSSSAALAASRRFWRTVQLSTQSVQATWTPCGIPPALFAQCAAMAWWTWCTSGPTRSCCAVGITVSLCGRDAPAATRWGIPSAENISCSRKFFKNMKIIYACLWLVIILSPDASPPSAHLLQVVQEGQRRTGLAPSALQLLALRPEPGLPLSALITCLINTEENRHHCWK